MHTLKGWLAGKQVGREAALILAGTLGPPHLAEGIPASSLVLIPEDQGLSRKQGPGPACCQSLVSTTEQSWDQVLAHLLPAGVV